MCHVLFTGIRVDPEIVQPSGTDRDVSLAMIVIVSPIFAASTASASVQ